MVPYALDGRAPLAGLSYDAAMGRTLGAPSALSLALKGTCPVVAIGVHLGPQGREQQLLRTLLFGQAAAAYLNTLKLT